MDKNLSKYYKNYYSQFGEDGIVEEVLRRIALQNNLDKWCVEFGAWDGVYLSNTCHLIRDRGYSAVLIEGDKTKVAQLNRNLPQDNVHKICRFINFEGDSTLDNVLSETPLPKDFDFLSIDIDGVDYYILESLQNYHSKIICIEFNPTIPNAVEFVQPKDFSIKQGSSAKAIINLSNNKGYKLVAVTACNLILVKDEYIHFIIDSLPTLEDLYIPGNYPQYLFVGYDGTLLSNRCEINLVWHGINVPIKSIQFLPPYLRIFGSDYGFFRKSFLFIHLCFKLPNFYLQKLKNRIRSFLY